MRTIAKFVSYLFHPLLMPTYGFLLLLYSNFLYIAMLIDNQTKWLLIGITFGFTFFMPLVNTLILLKMKRIKSIEVNERSERTMPYLSTVIYYVALFYLFYSAGFSGYLSFLILGAATTIFIIYLINLRWKISAHTAGMGGLSGVLFSFVFIFNADLFWIIALTLLVAGVVASARLKLDAHTPSQVYAGFALGFVIEFMFMIFI
jgi:membrane-associated phospholipid phosphatase